MLTHTGYGSIYIIVHQNKTKLEKWAEKVSHLINSQTFHYIPANPSKQSALFALRDKNNDLAQAIHHFKQAGLDDKSESKSFVKHHKSHEKIRQNVPFSDAVQVDNIYFLTGQIGKNHKTGKLIKGGIEAETKQTLQNIEAVLKHHNLTLKDVVKCTIILAIKRFLY